jgi:hypothetical protein
MDFNIQKHVLNSSQYIYFNDRLKTGYEVRSVVNKPLKVDTNVADADANTDANSFVSTDAN